MVSDYSLSKRALASVVVEKVVGSSLVAKGDS
jgi:hypothetical protein